MRSKSIKFFTLGLIAVIVMSSTTVFAATGSSNIAKTSNSDQLQGNSTLQLSSNSKFKFKESTVYYIHYTYSTAPEEVKAQHEANCKAVNKTPAPSDPIDVPVSRSLAVNSNNVLTAAATTSYAVGYDGVSSVVAINLTTHVNYYANIYTDIVGYSHIASGSPVVCLQALLNQLGYAVTVDGLFGAQTSTSVIDFQKYHGLSVDGVVGTNTWNTMLATAGF